MYDKATNNMTLFSTWNENMDLFGRFWGLHALLNLSDDNQNAYKSTSVWKYDASYRKESKYCLSNFRNDHGVNILSISYFASLK